MTNLIPATYGAPCKAIFVRINKIIKQAMQISVTVFKDSTGFKLFGYTRTVTHQVQIGVREEVLVFDNPTDLCSTVPPQTMSLLKIFHPEFGALWISETAAEITQAINNCCSSSGGMPAGGTAFQILTKQSSTPNDAAWSSVLKDTANKDSVNWNTRILYDLNGNAILRWDYTTDNANPGGVAIGTRRPVGTVPGTYPIGKNSLTTGTNMAATQEGCFAQGINNLVGWGTIDGVTGPVTGAGAFALGTSNTVGGRSAGGIGRGCLVLGDECFGGVGGTSIPLKNDGITPGSSCTAFGPASVAIATRGMATGNKTLAATYGERADGWGNLTKAGDREAFNAADLLYTLGIHQIPDGTANTTAGVAGQTNGITVWKSKHIQWGQVTTANLADNGYENEFMAQLKFSGKLHYGVTNDTAVPFPDNSQYFIHTGAVATLTMPDPTLATNVGRRISISNFGTALLTLSVAVYRDALTPITTLDWNFPNNTLNIICYGNKWLAV